MTNTSKAIRTELITTKSQLDQTQKDLSTITKKFEEYKSETTSETTRLQEANKKLEAELAAKWESYQAQLKLRDSEMEKYRQKVFKSMPFPNFLARRRTEREGGSSAAQTERSTPARTKE